VRGRWRPQPGGGKGKLRRIVEIGPPGFVVSSAERHGGWLQRGMLLSSGDAAGAVLFRHRQR
jgi:hypothetical protein